MVNSYVFLPIMHRPRFALVKATLIWCSSVTNPSFWLSHPRLGSCSIWESGKDRTSDMITKSFSLPRGEYMGSEEIGEIASCLLLEGILLLHVEYHNNSKARALIGQILIATARASKAADLIRTWTKMFHFYPRCTWIFQLECLAYNALTSQYHHTQRVS